MSDSVATTGLPQTAEELEQLIDERVQARLVEREDAHTPSIAIIATKGSLDWAYPPFILASTAAALGWEVNMFFTFYGLELLKKDLSHLQVSPLGNPGMPMKVPFGPEWLQDMDWKIPNILQANIPGYERLATGLMKRTLSTKGVASVEDLRDLSLEAGANLIACQMTVDLFNYGPDEFIDGIAEWAGAATYLPMAQQADVSLFI